MEQATVFSLGAHRRAKPPALSSQDLGLFLEVAASINGARNPETVFGKTVEGARRLLDADLSTLLMLGEREDRLEVVAWDGEVSSEEAVRELSTPVGSNLAGLAARKGRPLRSADIPADTRSRLPAAKRCGIRSALCAPVFISGAVEGVLAVDTYDRRRFTPDEERLLQLLADQAAIAIDNARLHASEQAHAGELERLVSRVKQQNSVMRRARRAHEELTRAALEGVGIHALTGILARLIDAPIALTDDCGERITAAAPSGRDDLDEQWSKCSDDAAFGRQLSELRANAGLAQPAPVSAGGSWRVVPVAASVEVLAFCVALDASGLSETEIVVLEEGAAILAAELLRERGVAEAEARLHGGLLESLMCESDDPTVEGRAALLGIKVGGPGCIVAIPGPAEGGPPVSAVVSAGRRACSGIGLEGIFGKLGPTTVGLLQAGDRRLSRETVEAWVGSLGVQLEQKGEGRPRCLGVSNVPAQPSELASAAENARRALLVSETVEGRPVAFFDDVELLAMFGNGSNRDRALRFVENTIGRLKRYDRDSNSDLVHTLDVYLDRSRVVRHAATALYLHPHSLRYRLRRIEEIQGLDLDDPMTRLSAHLAIKLDPLLAAGA